VSLLYLVNKMIVMYWNAQRHNWQMQENQTGISTDDC